jgi:Holliday junction resolvase RusA-like endonuclease
MRNIVYSVFVEGEPTAQPRPRKGRYGNFYNPGTADGWKEAVQAAFLADRKPVIQGPVRLRVNFFFYRSTLLSGEAVPHTAKPDIDNLKKAVMDALTEIQIWKDDSQVYADPGEKYWTPGKSGALILVEAEE